MKIMIELVKKMCELPSPLRENLTALAQETVKNTANTDLLEIVRIQSIYREYIDGLLALNSKQINADAEAQIKKFRDQILVTLDTHEQLMDNDNTLRVEYSLLCPLIVTLRQRNSQ